MDETALRALRGRLRGTARAWLDDYVGTLSPWLERLRAGGEAAGLATEGPAFAFDPVAAAGGRGPDTPWDAPVAANAARAAAGDAGGDVAELDAVGLAAQLRAGRLSPAAAAGALAERIERLEGRLNAFITRLDPAPPAGGSGPLWGVPYGLKDLFATAGIATTAASRLLADHVPLRDAAATARLRAAGAVLLGKLNTHEFAAGGWGYNATVGPAHNPWDVARTPGGSSSGSAVAVAARLLPFALGTDTAGSVRLPAALCGILGYKPTFGLVSCEGVVPLSWTLDTVGILCRSARDAGLVLSLLAERPDGDYAAAAAGATADLRGLRVGVPEGWSDGCTDGVRACFAAALDGLRAAGAAVSALALPPAGQYALCDRAIVLAESGAVHEGWLRTRFDAYGELLRARLGPGLCLNAMDYLQAQRLRTRLCREFAAVWQDCDVVATPTVPLAAPLQDEAAAAPLVALTSPFNVLGTPAASLPCGLADAGLPVGLQLAAPPGRDVRLLRICAACEATGVASRLRPPGID